MLESSVSLDDLCKAAVTNDAAAMETYMLDARAEANERARRQEQIDEINRLGRETEAMMCATVPQLC